MPFIQRHEIDVKIRGKHDEAHKRALRQALLNPALSAEQRRGIQEQIATVGKAKKYNPKAPPKPGAVALDTRATPPPSKAEHKRADLEALKKSELVELARARKLSARGTKADLVNRLLGQ